MQAWNNFLQNQMMLANQPDQRNLQNNYQASNITNLLNSNYEFMNEFNMSNFSNNSNIQMPYMGKLPPRPNNYMGSMTPNMPKNRFNDLQSEVNYLKEKIKQNENSIKNNKQHYIANQELNNSMNVKVFEEKQFLNSRRPKLSTVQTSYNRKALKKYKKFYDKLLGMHVSETKPYTAKKPEILAVVKIQAWWRGQLVRGSYELAQIYNWAATKIQSVFRGNKTRKILKFKVAHLKERLKIMNSKNTRPQDESKTNISKTKYIVANQTEMKKEAFDKKIKVSQTFTPEKEQKVSETEIKEDS